MCGVARGAWGCEVTQLNIPTPAELIEDARKKHSAEADAVIERIVAKLRALPYSTVYETAPQIVLDVVDQLMTERGWVCDVSHENEYNQGPSIRVRAPKGGAK